MNFSDAITKLQEYRKTGERRSREVVEIGKLLLNNSVASSRLGDEIWSVYEQVGIAAMDTGETDVISQCLQALEQRFPKSHRLMTLEGMKLESIGKHDAALEIYRNILKEDESNVMILKRQIACLRDMEKISEAIDQLNKYLDTFYIDQEGWLELCDLYLSQHMYSQSVYCVDELILQAPLQHLYHLKAAEIQYTMNNLPLALKEYCRALELCPYHVRSLYGIHQVTSLLLEGKPVNGTITFTKERLQDLNQLATEQLLEAYSDAAKNDKDTLRVFLALD